MCNFYSSLCLTLFTHPFKRLLSVHLVLFTSYCTEVQTVVLLRFKKQHVSVQTWKNSQCLATKTVIINLE